MGEQDFVSFNLGVDDNGAARVMRSTTQTVERETKAQAAAVEQLAKRTETASKNAVDSVGKFGEQLKDRLSSASSGLEVLSGGVGSVLGFAAGAAGLGASLAVVRDLIEAADAADLSYRRLGYALESTGQWTAKSAEALQDQASALAKTSSLTGSEARNLEALAVQLGIHADSAGRAARAAADMSAVIGIDAPSAMRALVRAIEGGSTVALQRMGLNLKHVVAEAGDANAVLSKVEERVGGRAAVEMDTYAGAVQNMGKAFNAAKAEIGEFLVEEFALKDVAQAITAALAGMRRESVFADMGRDLGVTAETAKNVSQGLTAIRTAIDENERRMQNMAEGDVARGKVIDPAVLDQARDKMIALARAADQLGPAAQKALREGFRIEMDPLEKTLTWGEQLQHLFDSIADVQTQLKSMKPEAQTFMDADYVLKLREDVGALALEYRKLMDGMGQRSAGEARALWGDILNKATALSKVGANLGNMAWVGKIGEYLANLPKVELDLPVVFKVDKMSIEFNKALRSVMDNMAKIRQTEGVDPLKMLGINEAEIRARLKALAESGEFSTLKAAADALAESLRKSLGKDAFFDPKEVLQTFEGLAAWIKLTNDLYTQGALSVAAYHDSIRMATQAMVEQHPVLAGLTAGLMNHETVTEFTAHAVEQLVTALGQQAGAYIAAALAGEKASTGMLHAALMSISQQAIAYALFETAMGIASSIPILAWMGPSWKHFQAAAVFGAVGVVAGLGARATPSGDSGGSSAPTGGTAATSPNTNGGRPQQITIVLEGQGFIQDMTSFARDLSWEITRQNQRAGV